MLVIEIDALCQGGCGEESCCSLWQVCPHVGPGSKCSRAEIAQEFKKSSLLEKGQYPTVAFGKQQAYVTSLYALAHFAHK